MYITFFEKNLAWKKLIIYYLQTYERNVFDMSWTVENEMKMDLINIINLLCERTQNKWQNNRDIN